MAAMPDLNVAARKADLSTAARKPFVPDASFDHKSSGGETIDKISKLNDKINSRIQSIISNYTSK